MPIDVLIRDYLPVLILFTVSGIITAAIPILDHLLGPRQKTKAKEMPYESGMNPIGRAVRRFPVRFYLVAVLFILFDVEVMFILPWAVIFRALGMRGLIAMLVFIGILTIGFLYEWKTGALDWK